MPVQNVEIAGILNQLADLLEIEGGNTYRVRAYRNAAQTVSGLPRNVADMVAAGEDLSSLPGIGGRLTEKLKEVVETGRLSALEEQAKKVPEDLVKLLKIPALGPKRVHEIYDRLNITSMEDLERAAKNGELSELPGFGKKIEQKILKDMKRRPQGKERILISQAELVIKPLLETLRKEKGIKKVTVSGSYRRRRETVGDVDILVTCTKSADPMGRFVGYENVAEVISQGETRSSVLLRSGLQVDLRVVPEASYGAALHYFTGSKSHNVAIRTRGVKAGLKINEYGVYRGRKRVGGEEEEEVFKAVKLPYIEPELRENRGEIEAADKGALPRLIEQKELRGDLHTHTNATDGRQSLEELAEAARKKGYSYLAVTDHSKRVSVAQGLDAKRLSKQIEAIDKLNSKLRGFRLLKGIEVDILKDGSLDLPDSILKELDLVVASVHFYSNLSLEKQTERALRAMENPYFSILGHPTGRLINERPPYEIDMERVLKAASQRGCGMEINSHPSRLDLKDTHAQMAKEMGVKIAISTDAHSAEGLEHIRFGVWQARRGGLEKKDVLNTRPSGPLKRLLNRK